MDDGDYGAALERRFDITMHCLTALSSFYFERNGTRMVRLVYPVNLVEIGARESDEFEGLEILVNEM